MSIFKTEPVRVVGYIVAVLTAVSGVVTQVSTNWDKTTGWLGLGFAVVVAVATEIQRSKVTPVISAKDDLTP